MTCVVAIVHQRGITMGADSVGVDGWLGCSDRADEKVFENGPYLIGYTTSFRMGQLLRYRFNPPGIDTWDLWRFMATRFVDEVRACLKSGGWIQTDRDGSDKGGQFLVGARGQLFVIDSDFQIGVNRCGYAAVGCGAAIATGAMAVTPSLAPRDRVLAALKAAEEHSAGVRGPFVILEQDWADGGQA